jgi:crotonobetainyl-CoA:carnitine CoA-transferase CaiB-like acyl-CoA transferase
MGYDAAFAGLKVIDLSQGIAGPYCAMLLAQHGADVIKVETPEGGDWARIIGKRFQDHSAFSVFGTLGKRSVALDLKAGEGKEVLWRLLRGADVFLEGFRPGTAARLGFGYDEVSAREPQIIYYSISGFGQTGPMAERPAMDPVLQAFTGLVADNKGEDGKPHRVLLSLIDMFSGLLGFQAVATSLYARRSEKRGRRIELSLMQGAATLQAIRMIASYLERGTVTVTSMPNSVYKTADGMLNITMVRPADWPVFCRAIGEPSLLDDARFADHAARGRHLDELYGVLRPIIARETTAYWTERLVAHGIMNSHVNRFEEFLREPQVEETGLIAWLTEPGFPERLPMPNIPGLPAFVDGSRRAHAARLGEHTEAVLAEHGFTPVEIAGLAERRVIAASNAAVQELSYP